MYNRQTGYHYTFQYKNCLRKSTDHSLYCKHDYKSQHVI